MNGDALSDSLLSPCFNLLTGLLLCVAVCTGAESAIETTSVFLVGEGCPSTSLVTISQLSDFVVASSTHSNFVLNSLSTSYGDLSCLGGGWCNNRSSCVFRKTTRRGSSKFMEKALNFTGILSNKPQENPDFFNWNRIKLRYCDGASFSGDSQDEDSQIFYRGKRIWQAAVEEFMSLGMQKAEQALLSGCSAGGLASILHCDDFRERLPLSTKVKCLSDAGMFLDAVDVSGGHSLRNMFQGVVTVQNLQKDLSSACTNHLDPTSCFFPQNLVSDIKTPMFLLNAAYDSWQVRQSLAPSPADPRGVWKHCKSDISRCNSSQLQFLQEFRKEMVLALNSFSASPQNGLFINSCFTHCQSEIQDTWFAQDSPKLNGKRVAESVGDWYFDRANNVKDIDCPYPCDKTCHHLIFQ
ncbi:hypothetical protein F2Q69_00062442 [Brassica cretica]|uniref:Pectin acetylesterase n=1 Tax=Brassica cretica TaxID=69181 RepID=A0A8S9RBX0_BRACR|nr:hypothetical protein F2Q69_00062442 [Brassica cretica]